MAIEKITSADDHVQETPDLWEFLAYRELRNGLEAGDIFCHDSVRFRSINDDLLDEELWRNHK
jgi:hypothetical protein